jgi:hypothetical protein
MVIHLSEHSNKDKKMVVGLISGSAIVKYIQENGEGDCRMAQDYILVVDLKKDIRECFLMDSSTGLESRPLLMEINMWVIIVII